MIFIDSFLNDQLYFLDLFKLLYRLEMGKIWKLAIVLGYNYWWIQRKSKKNVKKIQNNRFEFNQIIFEKEKCHRIAQNFWPLFYICIKNSKIKFIEYGFNVFCLSFSSNSNQWQFIALHHLASILSRETSEYFLLFQSAIIIQQMQNMIKSYLFFFVEFLRN